MLLGRHPDMGSDWIEHYTLLRTVFGMVARAGISLNIKKCKFGVVEVKCLGSG